MRAHIFITEAVVSSSDSVAKDHSTETSVCPRGKTYMNVPRGLSESASFKKTA